MKILVIDDNTDILAFLKPNLKKSGYIVDIAESGSEGLSMAMYNSYDLIILDLNLPDKQGNEICTALRNAHKHLPILLLTVESEIESKVSLLNCGADDYMTKPFSFEELLARISALLRRPKAIAPNIIIAKDLTLNINKQTVFHKKTEVVLTRKEFLILEYLMRHKGIVIPKITLLDNIWDAAVDLFSNAIETHILNIRKKLDPDDSTKFIKTISGRGYIIE